MSWPTPDPGEGDDLAGLGPDLDRLARHLRLARDRANPGRLVEVLLAAGERALALHAPREAAEHLGAAVQANRLRAGRSWSRRRSSSWATPGSAWARQAPR
jgi:hypothetical protein